MVVAQQQFGGIIYVTLLICVGHTCLHCHVQSWNFAQTVPLKCSHLFSPAALLSHSSVILHTIKFYSRHNGDDRTQLKTAITTKREHHFCTNSYASAMKE